MLLKNLNAHQLIPGGLGMDESLVDVEKELTKRGASNDDQATQNIAINKHFGRLSFRTLDFDLKKKYAGLKLCKESPPPPKK